MRALAAIDDWSSTHAAAAVIVPGQPTMTHGPCDREFGLASVTKILVALAVLVAVEEGSLALDDEAGPPGSTLRHLLAHASGLSPDSDAVLAAPGTRRIYSNRGFEIVGTTLERATAMTMSAYLHEAVARPLELRSTRLDGSPASGAVSCVEDLAVVMRELLDPTLIAPDTLASATAVAFPGLAGVLPGFGRQQPNDWGLGFELRDEKHPHWTGTHNSPATFGHFGQRGSMLWVDPDARIALVCLTDRPFGAWAAAAWPALADEVLAEVSS